MASSSGSVSADAMEAQEKIQCAMGEMINEIDQSHLRKIQVSFLLSLVLISQNK